MALKLPLTQPGLDGFCAISDAVEKLANDSGDAERGAIFTRREVVDFILDLAGFTQDRPLYKMRLLEPSFGGGEFLLAAVTRLFASYDKAGRVGDLTNCIRAVELHQITYIQTKSKVLELLASLGLDKNEALRLADAWLVQSDYLLTDLLGKFDFVVGNPPYVRQELIPSPLLAEYRRRYQSLYDRADLYIPFIEKSLRLLGEGGQLAFICADRWTKNKYGGPLRSIVAGGFHLRAYVDMVDTPAFDSDVIAYPAITLIARANPGITLVAKRPSLEVGKLRSLAKVLRLGKSSPELNVSLVECAGRGAEPWILSSSAKRALLRRLESNFPTLEDAGCKVGIGVATGADKVFIAPMVDLDVEVSRKVPLATTKDISGGEVSWLGLAVINPFDDDGKLVDLDRYPKLSHYLAQHREAIANRHVAKKNPSNWYRTIDRISPELAGRPKLLIPDIKGSAHVVFEPGKLYPHHNLYYVISDDWDLRALQAVLLSKVAQQFIAAYSTAMRGGFLRFQAQYLRRIRLPLWTSVSKSMQSKLIKAAVSRDLAKCDLAAYELYGFSSEEIELLAE